jgi:hypothetical protein
MWLSRGRPAAVAAEPDKSEAVSTPEVKHDDVPSWFADFTKKGAAFV